MRTDVGCLLRRRTVKLRCREVHFPRRFLRCDFASVAERWQRVQTGRKTASCDIPFPANRFRVVVHADYQMGADRNREDVITIGAINYIAAAVLIAPHFFAEQFFEISPGAMWTGGSMGAIYFVAFFFAIYSIKVVGASSTTVVSVLSILFPITVAAFVWDEIPNFQQMLGIGLALLALLLIGIRTNRRPSEKRAWLTPLILLGFFFLCGCSRLSQEAFKHVSVPEQRRHFCYYGVYCCRASRR